jgi:hypothetical protein
MASAEVSDSPYVTLVSSDGFAFTLRRECANRSGTIRRMLDPKSGFKEAVTGVCHFENIVYVFPAVLRHLPSHSSVRGSVCVTSQLFLTQF